VPTGYYAPPAEAKTNSLAIASLVCAFVFSPLGIIFGHIALSQIKRTGEGGRGLAIAGLVISYVAVILGLFLIVLMGLFAASVDTYPY
jgi:peptidyl-prolyl cis-trans isomerase B (cyclophilin B)